MVLGWLALKSFGRMGLSGVSSLKLESAGAIRVRALGSVLRYCRHGVCCYVQAIEVGAARQSAPASASLGR